jgi:hypothetical protein
MHCENLAKVLYSMKFGMERQMANLKSEVYNGQGDEPGNAKMYKCRVQFKDCRGSASFDRYRVLIS